MVAWAIDVRLPPEVVDYCRAVSTALRRLEEGGGAISQAIWFDGFRTALLFAVALAVTWFFFKRAGQ